MREYRHKAPLAATDHVLVEENLTDQDKLLFRNFVAQFRASNELGWYKASVCKSILDAEKFRIFFGEFQFSKVIDTRTKERREWAEPFMAVLDKVFVWVDETDGQQYPRPRWLCYRRAEWQGLFGIGGFPEIFGIVR